MINCLVRKKKKKVTFKMNSTLRFVSTCLDLVVKAVLDRISVLYLNSFERMRRYFPLEELERRLSRKEIRSIHTDVDRMDTQLAQLLVNVFSIDVDCKR